MKINNYHKGSFYHKRNIKREKHQVMVGKLMQYYSEILGWDNPHDMYLLGKLHDIGYAIVKKGNEAKKHPEIGGEFLKHNGYKFWKEVYYHGNINSYNEYSSNELYLLNICDLQVDREGRYVGFEKRIEAIKGYAQDIKIVKEVEKHIKMLKKTNIWKQINKRKKIEEIKTL